MEFLPKSSAARSTRLGRRVFDFAQGFNLVPRLSEIESGSQKEGIPGGQGFEPGNILEPNFLVHKAISYALPCLYLTKTLPMGQTLSLKSLFLWLHRATNRTLVPQPGTEPMSPVLGAQSLNHRTTREVPSLCFKALPISLRKKSESLLWPAKPHVILSPAASQTTGPTLPFALYAPFILASWALLR